MIELTDCLKCKGAPVNHDCDCEYCAGVDPHDKDVPSLNDTITQEVK